MFELHRRVAEGVTAALTQEGAVAGGSAPDAGPPTSNADAFAEYAQARVFLERPDVPGSLQHAIDLLTAAIRRDGNFALAYAALGEAYWAQFRETKDASWTVKAQAANLEALRIDRDQPEVHMALAVMYEGLGQIDKATEELRQVLALPAATTRISCFQDPRQGQWDTRLPRRSRDRPAAQLLAQSRHGRRSCARRPDDAVAPPAADQTQPRQHAAIRGSAGRSGRPAVSAGRSGYPRSQ